MKKEHETWLLPVFGERKTDDKCRALVWKVSKSSRRYLLTLKRRFERAWKEDPALSCMAYDAVPVDTRWIADDRRNIFELVPDFDDTGEPVRVEGLYEKDVSEHDTDRDLVYVTGDMFYFRVRFANTNEWYEAGMWWEILEGMFT